jgi:hypothetical protein
MINDESPLMIEEHDSLHILMPLHLLEVEPEVQAETEIELETESEPKPEFVEEKEAA